MSGISESQLAQYQALLSAQSEGVKPLCEFRAGMLEMKTANSVKTLYPDKRKGKVQLVMEDGILRFQWLLRPSEAKELDLMVFPNSATFERVNECKDGRVYVLKYKDSSSRRFFWLQEPSTDKDEETCKKINDLIKNPPPDPTQMDMGHHAHGGANRAGGGGGGGGGGDFNQSQLMDMFRNLAPNSANRPTTTATPSNASTSSTTTTTTTTPAVRPAAVSTNAPSRPPVPTTTANTTSATALPSGITSPSTSSSTSTTTAPASTTNTNTSTNANTTGTGSSNNNNNNNAVNAQNFVAQFLAAAANMQNRNANNNNNSGFSLVDLNEVLDAERIAPILESDSKAIEALLQHLPESQRTPELLRTHLRSPQFQQTINRIESLLNSEQYTSLMQSLSLPNSTGGIGVQAFLTAIDDLVKKEKEKQNKPDPPK